MTAREKHRLFYVVSLAFIFAIFCLRLVNLDQDVAPWGVSLYQPTDEGPYAYLAINEKAYGTIRPEIVYHGQEIQTELSNNFITNVVGNGLNILGFSIFGNNYYGLRVPYVFIGLLNLVLFWRILRRLRIRYGAGKPWERSLELAFLLWMAVDFSLFNASRIVEPTSVRLLFVQLAALVFISMPEDHTSRFLLLGIIVTFSCFLVYITNVFLYLATAMMILAALWGKDRREAGRELLFFALGSLLTFGIVECYYHFVWGTEAIQNTFSTIAAFSSNSSAEFTVNSTLSLPYVILLIYARIVSSNAFVYNLPLLFASCALFVPTLRMIRKERDRELLFLLSIVLSFLCQTFVSADTITRKMIVVYPIIAALVFIAFVSGEARRLSLCGTRGEITGQRDRTAFIQIVFWALGLFNVVLSLAYRTMLYDWTEGDFDKTTICILLIFQLLPVLAFGAIEAIGYFKKSAPSPKRLHWRKMAACAMWALVCLSNVLLIGKYYWINPEFSERDAMVELAEQVDDRYVLGGGYQLGFTLYNTMKPIVNTPEETLNVARIMGDSLYFDYEFTGKEKDAYFERYFFKDGETDAAFVPVHTVNRKYMTFGEARNMCLYKLIMKENQT